MIRNATFATVILLTGVTPSAVAQSTIDPNHAFAYQENVGWFNFGAASDESVLVTQRYLSGRVWSENTGWINLGNGPQDGVAYANLDDIDFGVNIDPGTGLLLGFAWGENVGWLNFSGGALATPASPARWGPDCRLHGYVWGENIGWLNLDDATHYVAVLLGGDVNGDALVDLSDLAEVLANFGLSGGVTRAQGDLNGDDTIDLTDLAELLANFGRSCPQP